MTQPSLNFRLATPQDGPALLSIYEPYITTSVTSEYTLPSLEEFTKRITDRQEVYPYVVCELDGRPVGYSYASRLFTRKAYDWTVELSVYCEQGHRGLGIGRTMYTKVMNILKEQHVVSAFAKVITPNPGSDALHRSMGFELVGTLRSLGYKEGWRDVHLYEIQFGDLTAAPEPFIPLKDVPKDTINMILSH